MKALYEAYRPRTFGEVIGQDRAIAGIKSVLKRGWGGRAFWIQGDSGTGKSTLAAIIAAEGADPFYVRTVTANELSVADIRDIEGGLHMFGGGRGGRALIIEEAHGLRQDVVKYLLVMLENLPNHSICVFTTTGAGQREIAKDNHDTGPLMSRCVVVKLGGIGFLEAAASRVAEIADREGLNGQPLSEYIRLLERCRGNMRAALQEVEAGAMSNDHPTVDDTDAPEPDEPAAAPEPEPAPIPLPTIGAKIRYRVGRGGVDWGVVDGFVGGNIMVHNPQFPLRSGTVKPSALC